MTDNEKLTVKCDKCGEIIEDLRLIEETVSRDVSRLFFKCSNCDEEYVSHYSSKEVDRLAEVYRDSLEKERLTHKPFKGSREVIENEMIFLDKFRRLNNLYGKDVKGDE